jgi:5-methylcytosine-specific restriction endonuclease McrA
MKLKIIISSILLSVLALTGCTQSVDYSAAYNRDSWGDWSKTGNCDTREKILQRDGKDVIVDSDCHPISGVWISAYDSAAITDSSKMDIDHIVPLKEAWDSGANLWTRSQMAKFYNDPTNLIAVSQSSNRSKGDKDPSSYLPQPKFICNYIGRYRAVKEFYRLSYDQRETNAIRNTKC